MSPARLRAQHIFLDVDGTLVDFEAALWHALRVTAAEASALTSTLITPQHLQDIRNVIAVEPAWRGRPLLELRVEAYRRVLAAAGHRREESARELSDVFVSARESVLTVYPDAEEALPELHAAGFVLVAATNGNVFLERQPIAQYLAYIHRADDVGVSKPDPRFFQTAMDAVGAVAETSVAVGDRIDNDIEPARTLGMAGVFIDREGIGLQDPTVLRIEALTELLDILSLPVTRD